MKHYKLSDSGDRGWFIGDFPKAVYRTKQFEVNYQDNPRGQLRSHLHKKITEITLVISGKVLLNGEIFTEGDIFILEPGDIGQMEYLEPTKTIAIKTPSIPSDKHYL